MGEDIGSKRIYLEIDWCIRALVISSLLLQVLLYFLPPLRKITSSKRALGLISVVFSLSSWLPSFTLLLICSRAIYGHEDDSDYSPPLLTWAALMLLHLAGLGQERQTPYHYSLQMSDYGKEFYQVLLKFIFYDVLLFGVIFLFESVKEIPNLTPPLVILSWMRTFSKLKHLRDQSKEVERLIASKEIPYGASNAPSDEIITHDLLRFSQKLFWLGGLSVREHKACKHLVSKLDRSQAIRIIESELNLIYDNFYGGVLPSMFELILISLLPALEAYSTTSFQACIFPVVHLLIITLFSRLSNPKFSLALFLSWYAHLYQKMTSRHGSKKLGILVDGCIIDATALVCMHQLVVNLWLKQQQSLVYQGNDHQTQRGTVDRLIAGINLLEYGNDGQSNRNTWSKTIPRFNLLAYCLRKPRKMPDFIRCLLSIWPVSRTEQYDTDRVSEFILKELNNSFYYDPLQDRNVISAKGQRILHQKRGYGHLVDHSSPFEVVVLRWHLATAILYHTDDTSSSFSSSSISSRDTSMILSDYMGYLLMVQPWIMSKQRGNMFRKGQDALLQIIELIHSSDVQGDHQSLTEEMQLKKFCTQMRSIYNSRKSLFWKKQTENHIEDVVRVLSEMQLSINKISQFLSFQYSRKERQPPMSKEKGENDQATSDKQLPLLPLPPPMEDHNKYFLWETDYEGTHIRAVVQSLSTMQLSLSKMSHFLSLQISKNVQQPRLPKEKGEEDQTARQKQPPQRPKEKDQTKHLDGKELIEDLDRKIAESLSEMQLSLNKFLQILSLQDSREEQQPAISKKKDEEDQTKTLALDQKQQPTTPRRKDEKDPIKFLDWGELSKEMKGAIKATKGAIKATIKMRVEMQKSSQHREKDAIFRYLFVHREQQPISPTDITLGDMCRVEGSLMKMVESFEALMSIQSRQDTIEEQTSLWPNKKDQTRSLVDDACDLATKIKFTIPNTHLMWKTIAEVWVGMLAYACIHSESMDHIRSLSQGGELASIVWLCMLHLEFVEEFDNEEILEMVIASKAAHSDRQRRYFGWFLNEHEV